jgi:hypothetical protein
MSGIHSNVQTASAASCTPGKQVDRSFLADIARQLINPAVGDVDFAVAALEAWKARENTNACWNPLATTLRMSGSTNFNGVGVKNYPDRDTGVRATAITLNYTFGGNGQAYAAIRQMLARQGFDEAKITQALKTWSGNGGYVTSLVQTWKNQYQSYQSGSGSSCNPSANQVALFMDINFSGQCVVKGVGDYANPSAIGLPNDSISSVRLGSNAQAVLCHDDNYGGGCEIFTSDDSDLRNNSIGNDQVSSIRVRSRTSGSAIGVTYQAHVEGIGWMGWVSNGDVAGTTGQSRRMEAVRIQLVNAPPGVRITYQAHVENIGWMDWVWDGTDAGTTGRSLRIEAVRIRLYNAPPSYGITYQAHVEGIGWMNWVSNGEVAGTTGQSRRMEAIRIRITGP